MKSRTPVDTQHSVAKALERLTSPAGRKELRAAAQRSREATDTFKRARLISPETLHRRFTV
jgi:hypothetical protein